jgi:protein TonB
VTARLSGSFFAALLVTGVIFLIMQSLVFRGRQQLGKRQQRIVMEFVRVRADTEVETKQRERPELVKPEAPPPQQMDFDQIAPPDQPLIGLAAPDVGKELGLAGAASFGPASGADTDVIPLVRVNPQYPPRAQAAGIEGRVHLRFTVTAQGTTKDIQVLSADPPGYFEKAAMSAVSRYKYKPRIEGGKAVDKAGVELVLAFKLKRS